MDPLAGSPWSAPATVTSFTQSAPNATLNQFARDELARAGAAGRALDLGCGAGRNAIPLAAMGWTVFGVDLSWPMLVAANERAREERGPGRFHVALAPMDAVPARDASFDLVVAHGIWNLARSAAEFRQALREAARVAKPGAALFVFTFSRSTLPSQVQPVVGEPFVFRHLSGEPQCFLTDAQLCAELGAVGFTPDPRLPLKELNRPPAGAIHMGNVLVFYEGAFRSAD